MKAKVLSRLIDTTTPGVKLLVTRNDASGRLTLSVCIAKRNVQASVALDATGWNDLFQSVALPPPLPPKGDPAPDARRCRKCGCTDNDCSQCIARTGEACHWVAADLCSACAGGVIVDQLLGKKRTLKLRAERVTKGARRG